MFSSLLGTDGFEALPVATLLERDTGRVVGQVSLPAPGATADGAYVSPALLSTPEGVLLTVAATPDGERTQVARLASPISGDVVWSAELEMPADEFPSYDLMAMEREDVLFIGNADGQRQPRFAAALRFKDGAPALWLPAKRRFDVVGDVAVVREDGELNGYDIRSGARLWSRPPATVAATPDELLVELGGGRLTLLEPRTGRALWSASAAEAWENVIRWDDVVLAYAGHSAQWRATRSRAGADVVAAFDLRTGRELWRAELGDAIVDLARGEGQLVATRHRLVDGEEGADPRMGFVGLDPMSGSVVWEQDLRTLRWVMRVGVYAVEIDESGVRILR
ncbi:MAG: PQQ-binding-like beta-propeller repeat protein [Arachnia sp.]